MISRLMQMAAAAAAGGATPPEVIELINQYTYGAYKEIMQDDPFAFYRLGEADGRIAYDETGRNDASYPSTSTLGETPPYDADYDPDTAASNSTASVGAAKATNAGFLQQGAFTIEGWIKVASGTGSTWLAGPWGGWVLYMLGSGRDPYFVVTGSGGDVSIHTTDDMVADTWYHLTAVYVPSDYMKLYVNGALRAQKTTGVPASIVYTTNTFNMGFCGVTTQKRTIKDVALYHKALTSGRIAAHYRSSLPLLGDPAQEDGAVAAWDLSEDSGTAANDRIAGDYDGTYENTPTLFENSLTVHKANRSVTFARALSEDMQPDTDIPHADTFSLEAWVELTATDSGNKLYTIIGRYNTSNISYFVCFDWYNSTLRCYGIYTEDGTNTEGVVVKGTGLSINTTYHVVLTFDGTDLILYMDGVAVSTDNAPGTVYDGNAPTLVGAMGLGSGSYNYWQGRIDEPAIYDYALSAAQVLEHFNDGDTGVGIRALTLGYSPLRYWRLGEHTGETSAMDETTNNSHGTYNNSPTESEGLLWDNHSKSMTFNGTTQHISLPTIFDGADTAITISAWIKPTTLDSTQRAIFYHGDNAEFALVINSSDAIVATFRLSNDTWATTGNYAPTNGEIVHVVAMWSKGNYVKIYINGVIYNNLSSISNLFLYDPGPSITNHIGSQSGSNYFGGVIGEVSAYDAILTEAQISALYNAAPHTLDSYNRLIISDAPVSYWRLGEPSGTQAVDAMGVNDGTYTNTPTLGVVGAIDSADTAITLSRGSSEYVTMGDVLDFDKDDPFSLECWFNISNNSNICALIDKSSNVSAWPGYGIEFRGDSNDKFSFFFRNTASNGIHITLDTLFNDGEWHHLLITYDGSVDADGVTWYMDGEESSITINASNLTLTTLTSFPLCIGATNAAANYFDGSVDEVAIYDYELDKQQARAHYYGGLMGAGAFQSYENIALDLGPVGYWILDEKEGTTAYDHGGTADGTITAAPIKGATSPIGRLNKSAMVFDGSTQYISMGDVHDFERTDEFSLACWFRSNDIGSAKGTIISKLDSSSPNSGYELAVRGDDSGKVQLLLINNGASNALVMKTLTSNLDDDAWHHIVATYAGTSTPAGVKFYLDGVDDTDPTAGSNTLSASILNNISLRIGSRNAASGYFDGSLCDALIFDKELTPLEARKLYVSSKVLLEDKYTHATALVSHGPIAFWRLDEQSGTNAVDCIGGNDGTYTNTPTLIEGNPFTYGHGHAVGFTATSNHYITMGDVLDFERTDTFSYAFWFKTSLTGTAGIILAKAKNTTPYEGIHIYQESGADQLVVFIQSTTENMGRRITATFNDGEWHHAVVTYDGSSTAAGIIWYIDGVLAASTSAGSSSISTSVANAYPFNIGARQNNTGASWDGVLDEVAVFDKELTAAEVAKLYAGTPADV